MARGERTPKDTRQQIVAMYRQGEPVAHIATVTGSSAIHTVLRQEGFEPDRTVRLRDPEVRGQREQLAIDALQQAAADLETDTLRIVDYRQWRKTKEPDAPSEAAIKRLFGTWIAAVIVAGLEPAQTRAQPPTFDEAKVIAWMRAAADLENRITRSSYDQWQQEHASDDLTSDQIHDACGWLNMRNKAGLLQPRPEPPFTNQEMIAAIREAANKYHITFKSV